MWINANLRSAVQFRWMQLQVTVLRVGKVRYNILSENKVRFAKALKSLLQHRVFYLSPFFLTILSRHQSRMEPPVWVQALLSQLPPLQLLWSHPPPYCVLFDSTAVYSES